MALLAACSGAPDDGSSSASALSTARFVPSSAALRVGEDVRLAYDDAPTWTNAKTCAGKLRPGGKAGKGAGHKECAAMCLANGGPMGLLTTKGTLYVLTMNHDKADAFNEAKKHAGDMVKVTGPVMMRNATRALEVEAVVAM